MLTNLSLVMHHAAICRQADRSTATVAVYRNRHASRLVEDDLHNCAVICRTQRTWFCILVKTCISA